MVCFWLEFFLRKMKISTKEEFFRELGLEPAAPFSFDVVDCLKRHCSLMKDLTMEEAPVVFFFPGKLRGVIL